MTKKTIKPEAVVTVTLRTVKLTSAAEAAGRQFWKNIVQEAKKEVRHEQ